MAGVAGKPLRLRLKPVIRRRFTSCFFFLTLPGLHFAAAKEAPSFASGDQLTPSPLVTWTDGGVMHGGKPDTQIMVSKTHVVLVTTGGVGFFDKKGTKLAVYDTIPFFTANKTTMPDGTLMADFLTAHKNDKPAWGFGDCKALYDPYRDRFWFLATFNNAYPGNGEMYWGIAVSNSGDPTKGWRTFVVPAHRRDDKRYTNSDFPMLGLDREAFYISVRVLIGNPEIRAQAYWFVLALNADEITSGKDLASLQKAELTHWPDPESHKPLDRGMLMPAISNGVAETNSGTKFVGAFSKNVGVWSLRHPFSEHPEIRAWTVPVVARKPTSAGTKPLQKGTDIMVAEPFGAAVISVIQSGASLYFCSQDASFENKQAYTAVHFTQLSFPESFGQAPKVVKDFTYNANSPDRGAAWFNFIDPSLMVNKNGDTIVVENRTGSTIYPEARASTIYHDRSSADCSALVKNGEAPVTGGYPNSKYCMWGDTARAALDPSDNIGLWVATQYGAKDRYHLAVGEFLSADTLRITDHWPGVWANTIQAAAAWPNGKIYLFRGSEYIRYDIKSNKADPGYPQPIARGWPGVWTEGIDTVAVWPNGKAYFFRGDQYIRYDIKADKADQGYPKPIASAWPGLWKEGIDAAAVWPDGKAYFFRGDQYVRYDIKADKADEGYPKPIAPDWPGIWRNRVDTVLVMPSGDVDFFERSHFLRGRISALPVPAGL